MGDGDDVGFVGGRVFGVAIDGESGFARCDVDLLVVCSGFNEDGLSGS